MLYFVTDMNLCVAAVNRKAQQISSPIGKSLEALQVGGNARHEINSVVRSRIIPGGISLLAAGNRHTWNTQRNHHTNKLSSPCGRYFSSQRNHMEGRNSISICLSRICSSCFLFLRPGSQNTHAKIPHANLRFLKQGKGKTARDVGSLFSIL